MYDQIPDIQAWIYSTEHWASLYFRVKAFHYQMIHTVYFRLSQHLHSRNPQQDRQKGRERERIRTLRLKQQQLFKTSESAACLVCAHHLEASDWITFILPARQLKGQMMSRRCLSPELSPVRQPSLLALVFLLNRGGLNPCLHNYPEAHTPPTRCQNVFFYLAGRQRGLQGKIQSLHAEYRYHVCRRICGRKYMLHLSVEHNRLFATVSVSVRARCLLVAHHHGEAVCPLQEI